MQTEATPKKMPKAAPAPTCAGVSDGELVGEAVVVVVGPLLENDVVVSGLGGKGSTAGGKGVGQK